MKPKSRTTLKLLLSYFSPGEEESYLAFLSDEERELMRGEAPQEGSIEHLLLQPVERIQEIHYSWMVEALKKLSGPEQYFTVASLPEPQRTKLAEFLQITTLPKALPVPLQSLFLTKFTSKIELPDLPHPSFMYKGEFSDLDKLSKEEILDLIDCLGVYDIAAEIRQIVDREQLHRLVKSLTELQQRFLKVALKSNFKWTAVPLGLVSWAGDPVKLARSLHKRGMMRLAFALAPESKDFLRHLSRKLDVKRAKLLEEFVLEERPGDAKESTINQVRSALDFIHQKISNPG